jgi:hypothetical protein
LCLDFDTFESAKKRARGLGAGCVLVRNFDQQNKGGGIEWWQEEFCWYFDGARFRKIFLDAESRRWHLTAEQTSGRAQFLEQRRLTSQR